MEPVLATQRRAEHTGVSAVFKAVAIESWQVVRSGLRSIVRNNRLTGCATKALTRVARQMA